MFFKVQLFLDIGTQQVPDLFIVDLQVGCMHQVLHVLTGINGLKNVLEGPGDDASLGGWVWDPLHGKGFATTGLTVGKYCSIVAFQHTLKI